jgi:drug/metabolite transporter (DMT)-like permease
MDHTMDDKTRHRLAIAALALAGSLWGTGFLFGKIAFREMTVSENVSFRFLAGSLALSPILIRRWKPYRRKDLWLLLLAGVIGVPLQFLVQFKGLQLTTVSHASLIVGTLPMLLALSSALILHERLRRIEWGLLTLSGAGAVLIAISTRTGTSGPQPTLRGDLLVLLSMFASVAMILCSKRLVDKHDAFHVTAATLVSGTIFLVGWVELIRPVRFHFSFEAWAAVLAQGLLATAGAYLLWNWGLSRVPASHAGVFLNMEPMLGAVLGVTLLHEKLAKTAILGGAMIVGAAVYFSLRPHSGEPVRLGS